MNILVPFCENEKFGFKDYYTDEVVLPPQYEDAYNFVAGRAYVAFNGKYGYIDSKGAEIIPIKYSTINIFSDGFAGAKLENKYGVID